MSVSTPEEPENLSELLQGPGIGEVTRSTYTELGKSGLRRWGGYVDEEFLPQLQGRKAVQVYREMSSNDPVIGAVLFAIDMILRQVVWRVEPASADPEDQLSAMFVEQCMEDMSHTWDDMVSEILSMLIYGWSWHEVVYKRRVGADIRNPMYRSKFTDGLIGWRKIPIRAQETLLKWEFDDDGGVQALVQMPPPDFKMVTIPIDKSLLFRPAMNKNNPEGRAQALYTPIPTPSGWRTMEDLVVGDQVFDAQGRIRYVTATQEWQDRPVYRLTFNDGSTLDVDEQHQWVTTTVTTRKSPKVRNTAEIVATLKNSAGVNNHAVVWAAAVQYPEQSLLVNPYVLGLWLGDGTALSANITCHVDDVQETAAEVERLGYPTKTMDNGNGNGRLLRVYGDLQSQLRMLGVFGDKHLPEEYLRSNISQRKALLAGLMDSDGHIDAWGRCEFTNTNKNLIDAVAELVRSLGQGATVGVRKHAQECDEFGKSRRLTWAVRFTPAGWSPFRLERKRSKAKTARARQQHYITDAEYVGIMTTKCIEVDSPDHLYLSGTSFIPSHNSVLRNAYRPWYFKKKIEEIEGIGIERDLAGLPVAKIPAEFLHPNAKDDEKAVANMFKQLVRQVRRDEQEGLVLPNAWDEDTKQPLYEFELLTSGGARSFDTGAIIERYEQRIAMTVLADFILLGNSDANGRGSYAMHTDKTGIFRSSLNSWAKSIANVFNRYELPRLFALNQWKLEKLPEIVPGEVDPPDLAELGGFIQSLVSAGMVLFPDPELENFLRSAAKIPPKSQEAEMLQQAQAMQQMQMASMQEQDPNGADDSGGEGDGSDDGYQQDDSAMGGWA